MKRNSIKGNGMALPRGVAATGRRVADGLYRAECPRRKRLPAPPKKV
ncbi:MAG: hypothetical protein Q4C10_01425 [Clostridia bacterium]|nr:hypothetical protein [Clostridia bacterium]